MFLLNTFNVHYAIFYIESSQFTGYSDHRYHCTQLVYQNMIQITFHMVTKIVTRDKKKNLYVINILSLWRIVKKKKKQ